MVGDNAVVERYRPEVWHCAGGAALQIAVHLCDGLWSQMGGRNPTLDLQGLSSIQEMSGLICCPVYV